MHTESGAARFVLPAVRELTPYVPGEQPTGSGWVKLNTNENPYLASAAALDAIRAEVGRPLGRYPEPTARELKAAAAETYGLTPEHVFCGNGSDEVLRELLRACVPTDGAIAVADPGYGLYRVLAEAHGCAYRGVPYPDDFSLPAPEAWPAAQLLIVTNPNSPTGVAVSAAALAALADAHDGLLLVDEAYADFADDDALALVRERDDVVVARTFSKGYSLAGVRLGLALGPPPVMRALEAIKDAYNVNRLALAAGAAALRDAAWLRQTRAKLLATRARLTAALEGASCFVYPSQSNFVLVRVGERAASLHAALAAERVLVRHITHPRVADCLRISIGTDAEIDRLLEVLLPLLAS